MRRRPSSHRYRNAVPPIALLLFIEYHRFALTRWIMLWYFFYDLISQIYIFSPLNKQGFPSIFLVRATDKMSPLKYVGNRSKESLRKFIEENRTPKKKLEDISPDLFGSMNLAINDLKRFFATSAMKDEL